MTTPLLTWGCVVGLFAVVIIIRLFRAARRCADKSFSALGFISEREEFFIPGDTNPRTIDDYDLDEFEDL